MRVRRCGATVIAACLAGGAARRPFAVHLRSTRHSAPAGGPVGVLFWVHHTIEEEMQMGQEAANKRPPGRRRVKMKQR